MKKSFRWLLIIAAFSVFVMSLVLVNLFKMFDVIPKTDNCYRYHESSNGSWVWSRIKCAPEKIESLSNNHLWYEL